MQYGHDRMPDFEFKGYLPDPIRAYLEAKFYAQINAQADFERLIQDPAFIADPLNHVGFFSDHGVVHVRDVTHQLFQILDAAHGVLIPERPRSRLDSFMKGYGEIVSYLHDIGMVNFSAAGRTLHAEFAAQWVYAPEFDNLLDVIWDENCGNIAWRLVKLANQGVLTQEPKLVLREMLAMSCCHSKSRVPIDVLNSSQHLRQVMQNMVGGELPFLDLKPAYRRICALYTDLSREAFAWLSSTHSDVKLLIEDVVDTLRALRCADALRQRGTVMKTSGNYEIFVDRTTAHGIIALRKGNDQLFLVTIPQSISSGEANIASSELGKDGNLRITFHRGSFATPEIIDRAAQYAAAAVDDIQADVIGSFKRPAQANGKQKVRKSADDILILLEGIDDNFEFAHLIRRKLLELNPTLQRQVYAVPSLEHASPAERTRYLGAPELDYDRAKKLEILEKVARSGHDVEGIHLQDGFQYVKLIALEAGETLIEAGSQAGFVYIPLGEGLRIIPLGGYQSFSVRSWMPLGNTGVIRGAARNATVVADQNIQLLMIPKEIYLKHWHHPYNIEQLLHQIGAVSAAP
jgi:hypothetical protein